MWPQFSPSGRYPPSRLSTKASRSSTPTTQIALSSSCSTGVTRANWIDRNGSQQSNNRVSAAAVRPPEHIL